MSLKTTVAASFRHMRRTELLKREFIYFLTIDRRWMNRDEVERLIKLADEAGLIDVEGDSLKILFDPSEVTIPLGFKPPSDIFLKRDHVGELIEKIARARDLETTELVSEMNALIQDGFDGNLRVEAAVVLLARKYAVPFEDSLYELKKTLAAK